jgi:hypothetical protein
VAGEGHRKKKDYDRINNNGSKTVIFSNLHGLKVHKIENFFGFDFGICVISFLVKSKY